MFLTAIDMATSSVDRTHCVGITETPEDILKEMCDCGWVSKQTGSAAPPSA